jgi:hypothetical protein
VTGRNRSINAAPRRTSHAQEEKFVEKQQQLDPKMIDELKECRKFISDILAAAK